MGAMIVAFSRYSAIYIMSFCDILTLYGALETLDPLLWPLVGILIFILCHSVYSNLILGHENIGSMIMAFSRYPNSYNMSFRLLITLFGDFGRWDPWLWPLVGIPIFTLWQSMLFLPYSVTREGVILECGLK